MSVCAFYLWMWIFVSFFLTISSGQKAVGNSRCNDFNTCFTLYEANPVIKRIDADKYCREMGQSLAVIPDEDTQNVISRLAGRGTGTDQLAWVGGLRGRDTKWKDPDGGLLSRSGRVAGSNDPGSWCSGVKLSSFVGDYKVFPLPCSRTDGYRAVCETSTPCNTDVSAGKFVISNVCHVVSDVMFTSWVAAQDHCERTHTVGNLAFSVIDWGAYFTGKYDNSEGYLWTGIQRKSWVWKTLSVPETLITYTNWLPSELEGNDPAECMVVDLIREGGWRVSDCDVRRRFLICEDTVAPSPVETTLRLTSPRSATPAITTKPNGSSGDEASTTQTHLATTESETVRNSNTRYTACSAELTTYKSLFGVFLVISVAASGIAIVQSCRLARRNKKTNQTNEEDKSHDYYNMIGVGNATPTNDVTIGAVRHGSVSDGEYAVLDNATRDTPEVAFPVYAQMS